MDVVELIKKNEDLRLKVYDDATGMSVEPGYVMRGHPTIGYGRALDVNGVTPGEAETMLLSEIPARTADLRTIFSDKWALFGTARQAVLIDMHYTLGPLGFREFHQMATALHNLDWEKAAAAMENSLWAREAVERVKYSAEIIRTGVFP